MKLVVDHIRGTRAGQRDVLDTSERVTIGRHPQNQIVFDAQGDIDASSRHAEIRCSSDTFLLVDVGSSNGTWIGEDKIEQWELHIEDPIQAEFGRGGPILRLWLGADLDRAPQPEPARKRRLWRRLWPF